MTRKRDFDTDEPVTLDPNEEVIFTGDERGDEPVDAETFTNPDEAERLADQPVAHSGPVEGSEKWNELVQAQAEATRTEETDAIDAARARSETAPGGEYIVNGVRVDANGEPV